MIADRSSRANLRPFLPADAARCSAIFQASIQDLTADDYDEDQRAAWASASDDVAAFGARLAGALTLIAVVGGAPVGFASLKDEAIDMLYVSPAFARRGIGAMLLDALMKLATARGLKALTSDVSDTARASFERQGFVAERRNLAFVGGEWLANTTMVKPLSGAGAPGNLAKPS